MHHQLRPGEVRGAGKTLEPAILETGPAEHAAQHPLPRTLAYEGQVRQRVGAVWLELEPAFPVERHHLVDRIARRILDGDVCTHARPADLIHRNPGLLHRSEHAD